MLLIYTDGSNIYNGKDYSYGGYGFVTRLESGEIIKGGGPMYKDELLPVTNNRAELLAIIASIEWILEYEYTEVTILSDSQWCVQCGNGQWKKRKNIDLWTDFNKLMRKCQARKVQLELKWVKGHAGIELNELADQVAGEYCAMAAEDPDEHEIVYEKQEKFMEQKRSKKVQQPVNQLQF